MLLFTFQGIFILLTQVFSKSFSIGEALVVSQGISFLLWSGNQNIIQLLSSNHSSSYEEMSHLQIEDMNKGMILNKSNTPTRSVNVHLFTHFLEFPIIILPSQIF